MRLAINVRMAKNSVCAPALTSLGFHWCNKDGRFEVQVSKNSPNYRVIKQFLDRNISGTSVEEVALGTAKTHKPDEP
jgi:hypothetical protein